MITAEMANLRKIQPATHFENSKVRKRFLSQMIPLCSLLNRHGIVAELKKTNVLVEKDGRKVYVVLEKGETRYSETDLIFKVACEELNYLVEANQMRGVIRTLVRWGVLSQEDISEEEIEETSEQCRISCANCGMAQCMNRFMQCKVCNERDKCSDFPCFRGFYCCKACQVEDWKRHKAEDH